MPKALYSYAGRLTRYDKDYLMLPKSPNGRTNIGTVSLDAKELAVAGDDSLTLTLSHEEPADAAKANWLPAPEDQFARIIAPMCLGSRSWTIHTLSRTSSVDNAAAACRALSGASGEQFLEGGMGRRRLSH
ncbi:DUF1214 domain-containing protein [Ensifer sp. P24N7]|uniref:DUF1214 domain-containing protein n=1 Tax=Sinorhizobium sp. P24N7 TaxID=3348358 RepID=UPI0035F49DA1